MRFQADRLFWILLLIPTVLLGVTTLVFLHREASHMEQQEQIDRARLLQQLEERAGNIVVSVLLSLREIQSSLLQEIETIPIDSSIVNSLQNLVTHNQLIHHANLWDARQGFLLKEPNSTWPQVSPLPWLPAQSYPAPDHSLPPGTVTLRPLSPSQKSVRERIQHHQRLMDLARAHSYNIPLGQPVDSAGSAAEKTSGNTGASSMLPESARDGSGWLWHPPAHWLAWKGRGSQHVLLIEILIRPLMDHFRVFLPDPHTTHESFHFVYGEPATAIDTTDVVTGMVSISDELPGWYLFFQAPLPSRRLSPTTLRWLGSLLVIGITGCVTIGGALLRQQLSAVHMDSRRKADFIANVSHELKTPLTTIRLYSEMLDSDLVAADKRYQYLDTIQRETDRLGRLVENLLNQNRLERNAFKTNPCSVQMRSLLDRLVERVQPGLEQAGIHFTLTCPETLYAWADPDAVQQILINLIDNAIKYAHSGKEVALEATYTPRGVVLSVKDRGPGIRASFRRSLFSPFERGDHTLHSPQTGMGLGLSIAHGLAQAMGGNLIYSPRPRKGAIFSLILKHDPHHPFVS